MKYKDLSVMVDSAAMATSSIYLQQGDPALTEDLLVGFQRKRTGRTVSVSELMRELDTFERGSRRFYVVRDAHRAITRSNVEEVTLRLERDKRNYGVRVLFVGEEPHEMLREWFENEHHYGEVTEPTIDAMGYWAACKVTGYWDYRKRKDRFTMISERTGLELMEHVGWNYSALIQAGRTLRAFGEKQYSSDQVKALIPPMAGEGYTEALVFGKGRRKALTLSQGVLEHEVGRTLGLVRYYLRQFGKLRAELGDQKASARAVEERTGVHPWHWRTRYEPVYGSYTDKKILLRQDLTESVMRDGGEGSLEVLALEW